MKLTPWNFVWWRILNLSGKELDELAVLIKPTIFYIYDSKKLEHFTIVRNCLEKWSSFWDCQRKSNWKNRNLFKCLSIVGNMNKRRCRLVIFEMYNRKHENCDNKVKTIWLHSDNIVTTLWQHCDNIVTTLWQHCDNIVTTLWHQVTKFLGPGQHFNSNKITTMTNIKTLCNISTHPFKIDIAFLIC